MSLIRKTAIYLMVLFFITGCEEDSPANLTIQHIDFNEVYSNEALDLPNGAYIPDNPDFDINDSETWTGNMEKYVNHNYIYSVSYNVRNTGDRTAYDTEVDLYYTYDNGDEKVETVYIGDIKPNGSISASASVLCTNKQLIECGCEAFWFD